MTIVTPDGRFEWDDGKAIVNLAKHGVSFEEATEVFFDPFADEFPDLIYSGTEDRRITVGRTGRRIVIAVVHVHRDERIRSISARETVRRGTSRR